MEDNLNTTKKRFDRHNLILWILAVMIFWDFLFNLIGGVIFDPEFIGVGKLLSLSSGYQFTFEYYLITLPTFIGFIVFTAATKRNRFVLESILPGYKNNKVSWLFKGLLVGFVMNIGCILLALLHGDIKLVLHFAASELPLFAFALVCVFIQSSSEEFWTRGFIYERVNVRYPLWVAILVNGLFFGALHIFNDGVGFLPILDICICGISFSLAKWYSGSIWFPMGIHTAWNFTQNYLFGLPNSGLVSEASVFALDASTARDSWIYNYAFGVEGAIPAVVSDLLLGAVCLYLAWKQGRLGELKQRLGAAGS